jgi:23S rRNA (adenine2503-C2)-methyltransferase
MKSDLKDMTLAELRELMAACGQKPYTAGYIFSFIHTKGANDISEITPLSKALRAKLVDDGYFISHVRTVDCLADPDGSTKYLLELPDGNRIEAVILRDGRRKTLCVSTQVGCAMGCAFCATGRIKLRRNLTAGEIVDQVNAAEADAGKISNIVYMGMGEPLANYDAVLKSVRILNHASGKNIGIRHITISTCGIAPAIERLADEDVHPRLAVSLSAPDDALRSYLVPIDRKYPIGELFGAIRTYQAKTSQRVTFEYVMIEDVNDAPADARALVRLLRGISCNVNLIKYNPYADCAFKGSSRERIAKFAAILTDSGIETTTRFRLGRKIKGACGQLQAGYKPARS